MSTITVATCVIIFSALCSSHPHLYNPFFKYYGYNGPYVNNLGFDSYAESYQYAPPAPDLHNFYEDNDLLAYLQVPDILPTLNILAEAPYSIRNTFTVVPMLVVSKNNMKMHKKGEIMTVSKDKPQMILKTEKNDIVQCTPAVKIILDSPVIVYSLKSSIVFPAEIEISHSGYKIPIRIGAVIAPVPQNTFVSVETPIPINVVYGVPAGPVKIDYVNNEDGVVISTDGEAVVVESEEARPPKNITVINFPEAQAEPVLQVDEEDEELVNRNPPIVLAPAGIVQSTQPQTNVEPFVNSKESTLLTQLREESLKQRI